MIEMKIDSSGLMKLKAKIVDMGKQTRFAAMRAINAAVREGAEKTKSEMRRVFDRPTPWVVGGVRYKKADKIRLEGAIDLDYWGNKQGVAVDQVLRAEIGGGGRRLKRHEIALQRAGILPRGMAIVPGDAAKKDAFGNMSAGQIVQIIAYFRVFGEQGYKANIDDKGRKRLATDKRKSGQRGFVYFALRAPRGKLPPGIYQRFQSAFGSAIKPVMIFVRAPTYRRRLDFYGVAGKAALAEFDRSFPKFFDEAMKSAK
ncbi:MAG: hypothetical protein LBL72_08475 [Candidatus Accumulibacter sp.]|jgi:hypothetical protein|nr:hypothetical protein [Accumulibacter sp.]